MSRLSIDNLTDRFTGGESGNNTTLNDFSIGNAAERFWIETTNDPDKMDLNDFTWHNAASRFVPGMSAQQGDGSDPFDFGDFDSGNIPENAGNVGGAAGSSLGQLAKLLIDNLDLVVLGVVALVIINTVGQLFTVNIGDSTQ